MSSNNRAHKDAHRRTIKRLAEYSTAAYRAEYEQIPVQYRAEYKRPVDQRRVFKKWHGEDSIEAQVYGEEIGNLPGGRAPALTRPKRQRVAPETLRNYSPPDPRRSVSNANDFSGRPISRQKPPMEINAAVKEGYAVKTDLDEVLAEFESDNALGPVAKITVAVTCIAVTAMSIVYFI